jgi:peptide/nickel transport system permease protein
MIGYVLRRILQFVPVLVLASILIWSMVYTLPGDPAEVLAGNQATNQEVDRLREKLGLDQSPVQQYVIWIGNALQGDLGRSYFTQRPVFEAIVSRLPATAQLAVISIVMSLLVAFPTGIASSLWPRSLAGRLARAYQTVALAVPAFWLGLLLILVFSVSLRLLPSAGDYFPFWENPFEAMRRALLPALALGMAIGGVTSRFVSASLTETMGRDYIRLARSKGLSEARVVLHHGLRNALLPVITIIGLQLGNFLGGAVVTEVIFNYPGIGRLVYTAISGRDYPLIQGAILTIVVVFLTINMLVDILYYYIDPRIRIVR